MQQIIYPAIKIPANEDGKRLLRAADFMASSVPPILPNAKSHISEYLKMRLSVLPPNALVRLIIIGRMNRTEKNENMGHFRPDIKSEPVKPIAAQMPRG